MGLLTGNVEVQFVVRADGKPDTATVLLLHTSRLSVGAGRSAARRLLTSCTFRPGELNHQPVHSLTVQRIEFKELKISVSNGRTRPAYSAVLVEEQHARGRLDSLYLETDSLLEDKPTRFQCRNPVSLTSQQGVSSMDRLVFASRNGGNLQVSFIVLPNGAIDRTSFRRERGPASDMEVLLRQQAEACVYLPGRIEGQAVPVRVFAYPGDVIFAPR